MTVMAGPDLPRGIDAFQRRLCEGVFPSMRGSRPVDWPDRDADALQDDCLWRLFRKVHERIRDTNAMPVPQVERRLRMAAGHLRATRALLLAVLFAPDQTLKEAARRVHPDRRTTVDLWLWTCWMAETAWLCLEDGGPSGTALPAYDREVLRPVAARLRFLVLTEPLRHGGEQGSPWRAAAGYGRYGLVGRALGNQSAHLFIGRCRQARWEWQRSVDEHQSHAFLAAAPSSELEAELRTIVFANRRRGPPLVLRLASLQGRAPLTADDSAVADQVVERHLLPRFQVGAAIRLAAYSPRWPGWSGRLTRLALWAGVAGTGIGAGWLAARQQFVWAAWAAGACYGLLGLGVVCLGRRWGAQWLLRVPAAAAVGLLVLMALPPAWWQTAHGGLAAPVVLAGAAYGYLMTEARNHGVSGWAAAWRAVIVTGVGAAHGLLVSLLGLVLVAPSYADGGADLARLWAAGSGCHQRAVLLLAVTWCLAVGVFSQILWEDRPITTPLAHLQWRRGR